METLPCFVLQPAAVCPPVQPNSIGCYFFPLPNHLLSFPQYVPRLRILVGGFFEISRDSTLES
jgi:hypothetical protein